MDWTHQAPLYSTVSRSLLKFMSTESVMLSHHLMLCCPLLLLPSIFSSIRVIRNWSLSFSFSPSNDYSRLISFIDCLNSLQSKGLSRVFSNNTIQKHQVFSAQRSLWFNTHIHSSVQSLNCVWLFATPMDSSTPDLPVHHQLQELDQTHVHWVGDAIQLSHPLSSPFPLAFNLSQHQGLF